MGTKFHRSLPMHLSLQQCSQQSRDAQTALNHCLVTNLFTLNHFARTEYGGGAEAAFSFFRLTLFKNSVE